VKVRVAVVVFPAVGVAVIDVGAARVACEIVKERETLVAAA
jgi:hypothetical protein